MAAFLTFYLCSAVEDMLLPLSAPVTGIDGKKMNEILVPKNTRIVVSILNANCDPEIWGPDSEDFKPERWLHDMPDTVKNAKIPGIYSNL